MMALSAARMEIDAGGVHLLAIDFRSRENGMMAARLQLEGDRDVGMHVAERAKS